MPILRDLTEQALDAMSAKAAARQSAERYQRFAAMVADVKAYNPPMPVGWGRPSQLPKD